MNIGRDATIAAAFAALPALGSPAQAEVKKFINICNRQICPVYEVVLNPPQDWVLDEEAGDKNNVQMIIPKGKTFGNAEALIYVKVSLKDKGQALPDFIKVSQERWRKAVPDTKITKLLVVDRINGEPAYETYRYENPSHPQQAFELTGFGIDTDRDGNEFVVQVVMTARAKKALDAAERSFQTFLRRH